RGVDVGMAAVRAVAGITAIGAIAASGAIVRAARMCRGRSDQHWRRPRVFAQLARREVPPVATVGVLTAQLQQYVASNFVAASGEMRPGVAKLTSTLRARLG